jgi:hypothetical protein
VWSKLKVAHATCSYSTFRCVWLDITRDGMESSLISELILFHLMFGWMDEVIYIFCLVGGTRMRGMKIII